MASKNGSVQCKSTSSECDIGKELVKAVIEGKVDLVASLLEQGADVNNSKNERGHTPLVAGCWGRSTEVVKLLIERGADVNMRVEFEDEEVSLFATPISAALVEGHEEVAALLIEYGTDVNTLGMGGKVGEVTASLTHLILAAESGLQRSTKLLLEHGAEVDKEVEFTEEGETKSVTALMHAVNIEVAKLLLEYGAQVNLQASQGGLTALMGASNDGRCEVARVLLEHRAEVDLQDSEGWSALMCAVNGADKDTPERHIGIVQLLIQHGAKIDLQNAQGQTALDLAREKGLTDIVELLTNLTTATGNGMASIASNTTTAVPIQSTERGFFKKFQQRLSSLGTQVQQGFQNMRKGFQEHDKRITQHEERIKQQDETITQQDKTINDLKSKVDDLDTKMDAITVKNDPPQSKRPELAEAQRFLHQSASEWHNIGVYLKLPPGVLKNIEKSYSGQVVDCLREMLTEWLNRTNPPPTWQALADAIRVFDQHRAQQIENLYMRK